MIRERQNFQKRLTDIQYSKRLANKKVLSGNSN